MMNKVKVPMGHKIVSEAGRYVCVNADGHKIRFWSTGTGLCLLEGSIRNVYIYIYICPNAGILILSCCFVSRLFHVVYLTVYFFFSMDVKF